MTIGGSIGSVQMLYVWTNIPEIRLVPVVPVSSNVFAWCPLIFIVVTMSLFLGPIADVDGEPVVSFVCIRCMNSSNVSFAGLLPTSATAVRKFRSI